MNLNRKMKWLGWSVIIIVVLLCVAVGCVNGRENNTEKYVVKYRAEDSSEGWINGLTDQSVQAGEGTSSVEAIAKEGYIFIGWSDGVETAVRQDTDIQGDMTVYAEFDKEKYSVKYTAGEGGKIEGQAEQEVAYMEDSEPVTAVAEFGYMFVKWSDGQESAERQDAWITEPLEVRAEFARIEKVYRYDYHYATGGAETKEVKIHIDHMSAAEFTVPEKEHSIFGGWYADKERTIAVTDAKGNLVIGQELFRVQTDTLYAKWTAEEEVNYTILLVFVTEIDAHGPRNSYGNYYIDLEYTLTEKEEELCETIAQKLKEKLNEIFYGLIHFEIDTYFTKEPVTNDMLAGGAGDDPFFYPLWTSAEYIPEVRPLINKYRAVLTTFNLNDYEEKYHVLNLGGAGSDKFADIYLDSLLSRVYGRKLPIEVLWDTGSKYYEELWESLLGTYLHEFCHTMEHEFNYANFHDVLLTCNEVGKTITELIEEYLLGLAEYEGEQVGIPYDYWIGNVGEISACYFSYMTLNGENVFWGELQSEKEQYTTSATSSQVVQKIPYGGTADTITAIAYPGYRFVKWSDGVTTATRRDENIISYFQVWAIFEPIE